MIKTVNNISDINLKNVLKKLNDGCIYFIFKDKEEINDIIHIFTVKDGEIVSNIYANGELWNVYGDTEVAYKVLHDINKKVLIYIIEDEKIIGQLFISRATVKIEGDSKEIGRILDKNRDILLWCCSDIYLNTPHIKYIRSVDKNKVRDFESYLEDDKYYLVFINISVLRVRRTGYLIYKGKEPVMAAYEDNYGILCGDMAYRKIKKLLDRYISTVDIYEYTEDYVKSLLDSYPSMRIYGKKPIYDGGSESISTEVDEGDIFDFGGDIDMGDIALEEMLSSEDITLSREELLKKLGLKEPDEEWVENILREYYAPSFEELFDLKKKIEGEIVKICSDIKGIKKVDASLKISWEDGVYHIEGDITIEVKKLFIINLEKVDVEFIKREVDNIIKKYIPTEYSSKISVNIL